MSVSEGGNLEIILRIPCILPVALIRGSIHKVRAGARDHGSEQKGWIGDRLHGKSIVGIGAAVVANAVIGGHGFIEGERAPWIVSADRIGGNILHVIDVGAELHRVPVP